MFKNILFIKNKLNFKYYNNKKLNFSIKQGDLLKIQYWQFDFYKYRIFFFGGICISKKNKKKFTNFLIKGCIWKTLILQFFFIYSPNILYLSKYLNIKNLRNLKYLK